MPDLAPASAVSRPALRPVPPAAADLGEDDEEPDPLPDETRAGAREAERRARHVMEALDRGARALVTAAMATGKPAAVLVRALLDAAAILERSYRWRDQCSHHANGRHQHHRESWDPEAKVRHRAHAPEGK